MDSVQTLVWLSGTPIGRILEHTNEEWHALIRRQLRAEQDREKRWQDKKKKEYNAWTKNFEGYLNWCEENKKKPSSFNYLKYKFRNKTEKGKENNQHEQEESPKAAGGAISDKPKSSSSQSEKSTSDNVKQDEIHTGDKAESVADKASRNTSTEEQLSKDQAPQTSAPQTTVDAAESTVNAAKDKSNNPQNTVKTDGDEIKVTTLTPEKEIEELEKQIASLTMKIGDGVTQI